MFLHRKRVECSAPYKFIMCYFSCSSNIQVVALLVFSNDGNGTEDAIKMADGMNVFLPMISNFEQIKTGMCFMFGNDVHVFS